MQKNILLISDSGGFMVDALANNLKKTAGFNVIQISPAVDEIKDGISEADIFLLYAGSYVSEKSEALVYLKDVCMEYKKVLCVIGYDKELELVKNSIPESIITRSFLRPFDMRKLADELGRVTSSSAVSDDGTGRHILMVDDDVSFLKMMQTWLTPMYHVTAVNSGMQAITFIATNTPDLILLDYEMPVTSGPQVLEMIRSEPASAGIPVIFLTGRDDRESVERVMRLKPQGYLLKTMSKEDIVGAVSRYFLTNEWKAMK
ncbi:MAG: response regulator [Ruminiclostridium sp.]|nr:response regulator [Ruminiclostridium sp.]